MAKVPKAQPRSKLDIEAITQKIVREFQPQALRTPQSFRIETFFETELEQITEVKVDYRELPISVYGYTDIERMESVIDSRLMESEAISDVRFVRSTIGHETGHVIMHVPEFRLHKAIKKLVNDDTSLKFYREQDIVIYRNPEWQAWWFAKCLLMPSPAVRLAVDEGFSIYEMSELFNVNPAFVRSRLKGMGLLKL